MLLAGGIGYAGITGPEPLLNNLKTLTFSRFSSYTLSIIPLFLLMGEFATKGGLNRSLFQGARAWLGHRRGGLAMATIGGCAAFGALCGSSLATAATMSQVAGPEMRRHGYSGALATGTLAAGGTLGILIPPSVILVIYAIYTEQSIGNLFIAAIVPGVLAAVTYMAVILDLCQNLARRGAGGGTLRPDPTAPRQPRHVADRDHLRRRGRRHLRWLVLAHRGIRHRRLLRRPAGGGAWRNALAGLLRSDPQHRSQHRVHFPDPAGRGTVQRRPRSLPGPQRIVGPGGRPGRSAAADCRHHPGRSIWSSAACWNRSPWCCSPCPCSSRWCCRWTSA